MDIEKLRNHLTRIHDYTARSLSGLTMNQLTVVHDNEHSIPQDHTHEGESD